MKGSCSLRTPLSTSPLISSILHRYFKPNYTSFIRYNFTTSSASSISCSPISHKPQIPLFLRPPIYSTTLQDLHNFITWAKTLASSVGSTFVHIDNGPDSALLLREFSWFLDDAIEDSSIIHDVGISQNADLSSKKVGLRVNLDEMYKLWQQRIEERRPFQYIVGCEHWRDLVLSVQEGVLIPRPETEKIIDLVGERMGKFDGFEEGIWADLGTGSGALAIAISRILSKNARVIATDLSPIPVAVASYNVERYGLQVRQLAGIVSNPPYIPSKDINGLQSEVGKHEPVLALDGGIEGLDKLVILCMRMSEMLKPGGFFVLETNGEKQCQILANYLKNSTGDSFCDVTIITDFAGISRFVTGHRT
ncbi:Release factor glutamine methyltransferase [Bienertia sinuspersici]